MDEWAFRRGHTYGTVLVDLERHRPLDLLPDRKTETLAAWLKRHPGIQIISRDRAGAYAEGARQGAPQAVQIADRWHLLKNLRDTAERALNRDHAALRRTAEAVADSPALDSTPTRLSAPAKADSEPHSRLPTRAERERQARRERRLARYQAVCDLHQQGGSIRAIARHLGLDRRTVRYFLLADGFPERMARPPVPSLLDPFRDYLHRRWNEGCRNARQLFREIVAQGFQGSESIVRQAIHPWRLATMVPTYPIPPVRAGKSPARARPWLPSPRQVSFWLLDLGQPREPDDRDRANTLVTELCARVPSLQAIRDLGRDFMAIVRQRRAKDFPAWLEQVQQCAAGDLKAFARGLESDYDAVLAALRLPWSQGQVEGQVNRLKLMKRSMYGRASFDLLRQRVLAAA